VGPESIPGKNAKSGADASKVASAGIGPRPSWLELQCSELHRNYEFGWAAPIGLLVVSAQRFAGLWIDQVQLSAGVTDHAFIGLAVFRFIILDPALHAKAGLDKGADLRGRLALGWRPIRFFHGERNGEEDNADSSVDRSLVRRQRG
jgi:hypothetical protein